MKSVWSHALLFVSVLFGAHAAAAATVGYPVKPIRLIVPFTPGGSTDIPARGVANALSASLGRQVVVDNRAGSAGIIAGELVAKAQPDGYTLLMGSIGMLTVIPNLRSSLPYDPQKSFAPVSMVSKTPTIIVAHPSLPANSLKELIALARAKPGTLSFGSPGMGSSSHLCGELFKAMLGIDLVHVPYKGAAPAVSDLLGGQVLLLFDTMASLPHIKAGKLKPLAISTATRSPLLPDVPTIAEAAIPGFETVSWNGILVPAGTPKEIVARLNAEIVKALTNPELRERLEASSYIPKSSTPEEFGTFIGQERAKWGKVIRQANIRVE
jgi:tripartite-type tricarboxylate transporter receptor subunit TctC